MINEVMMITCIGGAAFGTAMVGIIVSGYVKASPDKAYIISGLRK